MRARVEINLPELDAVLDQARREPLSEPDYQKDVMERRPLPERKA